MSRPARRQAIYPTHNRRPPCLNLPQPATPPPQGTQPGSQPGKTHDSDTHTAIPPPPLLSLLCCSVHSSHVSQGHPPGRQPNPYAVQQRQPPPRPATPSHSMGTPAPPCAYVCLSARRRRGVGTEERDETRRNKETSQEHTSLLSSSPGGRNCFLPGLTPISIISIFAASSRSSRSCHPVAPARANPAAAPNQLPSSLYPSAASQPALDIRVIVLARPASVGPDVAHGFPDVAVKKNLGVSKSGT
jgi:hypothetical protein